MQRYVKAITAMGSLNLDEGLAMGVTMPLAHSVLGIVAPEISAPRFRQGTSGEDGATGSCLFGGSVALVALRSHLSSRRGGMAVGSRCRSSWIMSSTSCRLVLGDEVVRVESFGHDCIHACGAGPPEERHWCHSLDFSDSTGVGQERRLRGQEIPVSWRRLQPLFGRALRAKLDTAFPVL